MKYLESPPVLNRPAPLWSWNDKLEPDELRRQAREMVAQGWGGYFMHPRVGYTTHYLSDAWMDAVHACIDEARKLGVRAWIYDEDRWPSGFGAGGIAERDPAFRSRALVIRLKGTERKQPATEKIGKWGTVYGVDHVLQEMDVNGTPYVICEQVAELGTDWFNGSTYPDLMNPDAMRAFIDQVLERYRQACGQHFGRDNVIPGVFTDEPHYLANALIDALGVPWSTKLPDYFKQLKGYDIREHLPKLFLDQGDFRRVRFDFYDVASRLFRESFTRQYFEWCDRHNLIFTGHFQAEDTLRLQAQWTGDVMAHYPHMHWPGIDQLERKLDQVVLVKQLTSVTDQLGKERAFCESFGISGMQVAFFHRKWIADWLMALGINFINPHLTHYSLRGPRKRDCPPYNGPQSAWWPDERGLSDYLSRVCALMTGGTRRVDVLLLQPLSSVWCDYSPMQWDSNYAPVAVYDEPYQQMASALLAAQIDFHIGNETIMAEHGSVEGGRLKIGRQAYRIIVIPPTLNLRSSTLKLLTEFLAGGGQVIVTGSTPTHVDGQPAQIKLDGAKPATRLAWAVDLLLTLMPERLRAIDVLTGRPAGDVLIHSRDKDDGACHLLVNTAEEREVGLRVEIPAVDRDAVAVYDPLHAELYRAPLASDGTLRLTLAPAGSVVLLTGAMARNVTDAAPGLLGSGATLGEPRDPAAIAHAEQFDITLLDENVLRVDEVELEIAGKHLAGPVNKVLPDFLAVPDGTPFRAVYQFRSDCELSGCTAVIDSAEHLDVITFNGQPVQPLRKAGDPLLLDPSKSWRDIALTRVPLPTVRRGENTLVIGGRKVNVAKPTGVSHRKTQSGPEPRETQLEEVLILGDFTVQPIGLGRHQLAAPAATRCSDLTRSGAPFYAGRALFRCTLNVTQTPGDAPKFLVLDGLEAASARVRVNGRDCGVVRWRPHVVDVARAVRAGANQVEIELAATLYNVMGPTRFEKACEERRVGPSNFRNFRQMKREHDLLPFGLLAATLVAG